ncbi:MAG: transporter [Verrucomicrobiota bacterium]|nr:transporter [Verrucomicrobiota bacterium]
MAGTAFAGRPLTIDDAEPVGKGHFEVEVGVQYTGGARAKHLDIPFGIAWGVGHGVELSIGFGGQFEEQSHALGRSHVSGAQDLFAGGKWKLASHKESGASLALAASLKFPTADHDHGLGTGGIDFDFTLIASREWGRLALDANAGYTVAHDAHGDDVDDVLHGGFALRFQLTRAFASVAEVVADVPVSDAEQTVLQIGGGAQFAVHPDLVLDWYIGTGFRHDSPDLIARIGFTWSF